MKPIHTFVGRAGVAALLLLAGFVGSAQAAGTASGTAINNNAKLDYSVNGVGQAQICSSPTGNSNGTCTTTQFLVDTKVNVNVVTTDGAAISTTPGATGTMTFTVTNTGNATQDLVLASVTSISGGTALGITDTFDPTGCSILDSTGTAIAANRLLNVAADASVTVKLACTIAASKVVGPPATPFAPTDGALVALKATVYATSNGAQMAESASPTIAGVDVALADTAGSDDGNRDAAYSARSGLKVAPAALNVTKIATALCDPFNLTTSPKAIPGAFVRYTVTIQNGTVAGTQSAAVTTFTDNIDANLNADVDLITGATKCDTSANGGVATNGAGKGIQVAFTPNAGNSRASFSGGPKFVASSGIYSNTQLLIPTATWTATLLPAEGAYAAGELKPGDTLTLIFNAIVK